MRLTVLFLSSLLAFPAFAAQVASNGFELVGCTNDGVTEVATTVTCDDDGIEGTMDSTPIPEGSEVLEAYNAGPANVNTDLGDIDHMAGALDHNPAARRALGLPCTLGTPPTPPSSAAPLTGGTGSGGRAF